MAIIVCHIGDLETGARAVAPIKQFGSPVMDVIGQVPYSVVNTCFDAGFPPHALNYWQANFLATLSDDAIDTMIARFAVCPSPPPLVPTPTRGEAALRPRQRVPSQPEHQALNASPGQGGDRCHDS